MPPLAPRRLLTPLIHVLAWGLLALTLLLFQPAQGQVELPAQYWVKQGVQLLLWVAVFYLTARLTVPRLLLRGHGGWFALALLATAVVVLALGKTLEASLHLPELMHAAFERAGLARPAGVRPLRFKVDFVALLITLLVLGIATAITVVQHWQQETQLRERFEQQRVEAELALLKGTIWFRSAV